MNRIHEELQDSLANHEIKGSIVPLSCLYDLQTDLNSLNQQGLLNTDFFNETQSRFGELQRHPESPVSFSDAESIIITAVQQPKVQVQFNYAEKVYSIIIPPTYLHDTDEDVFRLLSQVLIKHGYTLSKAVLPEKSIAVHAGLAAYGKNNIAYIEGWGSFFRLKAFYTDLPSNVENWHEFKMMERCEKCTACKIHCPTDAIRNEQFVIDATRCLTYLNESEEEFPEWIDPAWHNCLIGCMICQDKCPANSRVKKWIHTGENFSDIETQMILNGMTFEELPDTMKIKLRNIYMVNDFSLLQRNLYAVIKNYR